MDQIELKDKPQDMQDLIGAVQAALEETTIIDKIICREDDVVFSCRAHMEGMPFALDAFVVLDDDLQNGKVMCSFKVDNGADNQESLIALCNKINRSYRFLKFYVDEDADVLGHYDLLLYGDNTVKTRIVFCAYNIFIQVVKKNIPQILKTVWDLKDTEAEEESK